MKILVLRLHDFRLFDDLELSLSPGVNLIRGPNESGKSTIVSAILALMFEKPTSTSADVSSLGSWGAPEGPRIEMEFEHDGTRYLLVKDFAAGASRLVDTGGDLKLETVKAVENKLREFSGFGDSDQYLRTACVTHDQMTGLARDRRGAEKLAGMLREVVVGRSESDKLEWAIRELSGGLDELRRGLERPAKNPGIVARLQEERERFASRHSEVASEVEELENNRLRLSEVEGLIVGLVDEIEEMRGLIDKNRRIKTLESLQKEVRRRFDTADRVRDARAELEKLDERIDRDYSAFQDVGREAADDILKGVELCSALQSQRDELAGEMAAGTPGPGPAGRSKACWAAAVAGALLVLAGVALGMVHTAFLFMAGAGVLALGTGAILLYRSLEHRHGDAAGVLEKSLKSAEARVQRLKRIQSAVLESTGCGDVESFLEGWRAYSGLAAAREKAAAGLAALLGEDSMERAEEERREASLEVAKHKAELDELEPFRLEPERLSSLMRKFDEKSERLSGLEKERDGLKFHTERASVDPEEALAIEERLAYLGEEEGRALRRMRVYAAALDAMEKARSSLLSSAVPLMAESVGGTFSSLTGGRYEKVEIGESDLSISVFSREKGEFIPAEEVVSSLSKGTVSQLYLASRLKLVELLSGGRKPPLIFDDSFSYFDDERLERLWGLLEEAGADRQILVLTCAGRYDRFAGPETKVIDLGTK